MARVLSANHLFAVVFAGQRLQRWLNDTTAQTEDQVQGRLLLDVVVRQGAVIFQLLAGKDEALLVGRNALLVLNLLLHVLNGVGRLDLCTDGQERGMMCVPKVMVLPVSVLTKICIYAV